MAILGDEEKRAVYDQTGCVDDAVSTIDIFINFTRTNQVQSFQIVHDGRNLIYHKLAHCYRKLLFL